MEFSSLFPCCLAPASIMPLSREIINIQVWSTLDVSQRLNWAWFLQAGQVRAFFLLLSIGISLFYDYRLGTKSARAFGRCSLLSTVWINLEWVVTRLYFMLKLTGSRNRCTKDRTLSSNSNGCVFRPMNSRNHLFASRARPEFISPKRSLRVKKNMFLAAFRSI